MPSRLAPWTSTTPGAPRRCPSGVSNRSAFPWASSIRRTAGARRPKPRRPKPRRPKPRRAKLGRTSASMTVLLTKLRPPGVAPRTASRPTTHSAPRRPTDPAYGAAGLPGPGVLRDLPGHGQPQAVALRLVGGVGEECPHERLAQGVLERGRRGGRMPGAGRVGLEACLGRSHLDLQRLEAGPHDDLQGLGCPAILDGVGADLGDCDLQVRDSFLAQLEVAAGRGKEEAGRSHIFRFGGDLQLEDVLAGHPWLPTLTASSTLR